MKKILLCGYIVILLCGLGILLNNPHISYAIIGECSAGRTCQKPTDSLDCKAEGVCPGATKADLNYQECCKPKTTDSPTTETNTVTILSETIETNTLNGFMQIAVAVSKWILGITGSLTLLMFIYGGVMFLISSGSSEKVTQAKQIIIGAVIGLIIVFAAYTIIGFTFKAMGLEGEPWYQSGWFK